MNAHQRRLVRRALLRLEHAEVHDLYEWDQPPMDPRIPARVQALLDRRPGARSIRPFNSNKRQKAAYGLRCDKCNRPAMRMEPGPRCLSCSDDIPF